MGVGAKGPNYQKIIDNSQSSSLEFQRHKHQRYRNVIITLVGCDESTLLTSSSFPYIMGGGIVIFSRLSEKTPPPIAFDIFLDSLAPDGDTSLYEGEENQARNVVTFADLLVPPIPS